jgi:hypothetical protein
MPTTTPTETPTQTTPTETPTQTTPTETPLWIIIAFVSIVFVAVIAGSMLFLNRRKK